ncbi:hypothetical protein M6B38_342260 [Iris pallida]|uniref:Uncharacterized protein n=1 Tax=Iris pallida TaxID=29817 RepID=A0AAX6GWN6_IRIPA|nr:hypothetical protein M6B38_342260 [Iris pallida]
MILSFPVTATSRSFWPAKVSLYLSPIFSDEPLHSYQRSTISSSSRVQHIELRCTQGLVDICSSHSCRSIFDNDKFVILPVQSTPICVNQPIESFVDRPNYRPCEE